MIIGVWRRLVVGVLLSIVLVVGLDVAARMAAANAAGGSGALAVVAYSGEEDDIEGVVSKWPDWLKPKFWWKVVKCGACHGFNRLLGWGPDCSDEMFCGGDWR